MMARYWRPRAAYPRLRVRIERASPHNPVGIRRGPPQARRHRRRGRRRNYQPQARGDRKPRFATQHRRFESALRPIARALRPDTTAFVTIVTATVTNRTIGRIATFRSGGSGSTSGGSCRCVARCQGKPGIASVEPVARRRHKWNACSWSGERTQTDAGDLNVPLPLECKVVGQPRWLERAG